MFSWKIICVNCGSEAAPRPERAGYPTRSFQKSIRLHSQDGSRAQGAIPHELMAMTGALHSRGVRKRSWRTRRCEAQRMNLDCPTVITRGTIRAKSAFRSNENFRNGAPYGNRTRVSALRGPRPRPLDEGSLPSRNTLPGAHAQASVHCHSGARRRREPGIHSHEPFEKIGGECSATSANMDSGFRPLAGPGMTA
jgi:hypothetical protein